MADSQKFIARNRAPRVQIEYDVELYGSEKSVQLPFVMGVMSDLSGKSDVPQPSIADRKFLEIDVDNFDDRMRAMKPRAAFAVPNTLTGEGNLSVDLTFEKMDDFTPGAIAAKIPALATLLDARTQLANLATYMDGKVGAEALIERILKDPGLLKALAGQAAPDETTGALASLRAAGAALPADTAEADDTDATLAALSQSAPAEEVTQDDSEDVLDGLRGQTVQDEPAQDDSDAALDTLRAAAPVADETPDDLTTALDSLAGSAPPSEPEEDQSSAVFDTLRQQPDAPEPEDESDDILASLAASDQPTDETTDELGDILGRIERTAETPQTDDSDDVLAGLSQTVPDEPEPDDLDDILGELGAADDPEDTGPDAQQSALEDLLSTSPPAADDGPATDGVLEDLASSEPTTDAEASDDEAAASVLDGLAADTDTPADDLDNLFDELNDDLSPTAVEDQAEDTQSELDDLLAEADDDAPVGSEGDASPEPVDDLDDLLSDLDPRPLAQETTTEADAPSDLDDLLGDLDSDGDIPAQGSDTGSEVSSAAEDDDLDDLLSDLSPEPLADEMTTDTPGDVVPQAPDPLDDLLADMEEAATDTPTLPAEDESTGDDLEALLADDEETVALDDNAVEVSLAGDPFGALAAPRPDAEKLKRTRFRIAILGDFTGRASGGLLEVGDDLAKRPAIPFDIDELDEVIEGFATTLTLQLGTDGPTITVPLNEIDDLHPDELFEKVDAFSELQGLKARLVNTGTASKAMEQLRAWGQTHGAPIRLPKTASHGAAMRADLRLSDFQRLIGETSPRPAESQGLDDLVARVVGPHISDAPDDRLAAAVDEAATHLMRLILHHPDFQAIEAQWRGLDMLARRIETDDKLELVLYDVSADEIAADLVQADDLSETGLFRMLTEEPLDEELGRGGYSALFGLYQFEETPPHAEMLARVARLAAHIDAPFISAISPAFLDTPKEDRHALVAQAWDRLREMPEAGHLGLCSPRFMLRRPYGAKTDPISAFNFEEFTNKEGLRGLLWGNPALLAAELMAQSYTQNGPSLQLGKVLQIGDMPYHFVTDGYGDQVALPCTERNITLSKSEIAVKRGIMPLLSIKGRDEIRLGSYRALSGEEMLGPWTGHPPPPPTPPRQPEPAASPEPLAESEEDTDLDDLLGDLVSDDAAADTDLDDLLASFSDDANEDGDDGTDMDAELQALLEDL